jgi:hypothetical protein
VFTASNLARRHGSWPYQASSVARLEARLPKSDSWLLVAEDSSALLGMAFAEPMRDEDGAGAVVPGACSSVISTLFQRAGERGSADCSSTLLWQKHYDTTTGGCASGPTKTTIAPTVSTEATASGQPAASRMVRASG